MQNRRPDPDPKLPHKHDREETQPYSTEVEAYKHGVAQSPKEQGGRDVKPKTTRAESRK
jgi:hypothetical protein